VVAHLEASGTPHYIGFQHGSTFADEVRACRDFYCRFPATPPQMVDEAIDHLQAIHSRHFPAMVQEMRGIADGSGLPYRDVLALNFFAQIVGEAGSCSNIGVSDSPQGPIVAKTSDLREVERDFLFIKRARPDDGLAYIQYTFYGTVWNEGGFNASGLSIVNSGLMGQATLRREGVAGFALQHAALSRCTTVDETVKLYSEHDLAKWGGTILVADAAGGLVLIEKLPGSQALRQPLRESHAGLLIHTNHVVCFENGTLQGDADLESKYGYSGLLQNSLARYATLERIAPETGHSLSGLQEALRNHSPSGPICQHGQQGLHSAAGIVIVPRTRTMWGTAGYPCQTPFEPYTLAD